MALIQTIDPQEATGPVKEIYDKMMKVAPVVPRPLQMLSSSPELLSITLRSIMYYVNHPRFSPLLLAHIRLLVAHRHHYNYCVMFNTSVMQMLSDISDEQLEQLKKDPSTAALEDKEKQLLLFVLKAVATPEAIDDTDVSALREMGWTDQEIVEATHYGADMVRHGILFKAFKMDEV
ncbi:MAG: carboxymuconolactone decarboxylase family protein [Thermodesulfobacteriota bacterium]